MTTIQSLLSLALTVSFAAALAAAEPPRPSIGFRGEPCGGYPEARPPLALSPENLRWTADVGEGCGAVIVVGETLFVQGSPNALICLDKKTSRVLWRKDHHAEGLPAGHPARRLDEITEEIPALHRLQRNAHALPQETPERDAAMAVLQTRLDRLPAGLPPLPGAGVEVARRTPGGGYNGHGYYLICLTPSSDGQSVVAAFPTGVVVSYDLHGNRRWTYGWKPGSPKYNRPEDNVHSSAPIFADGKVFAIFAHDALCLDAATGKPLWEARIKSSVASPVAGRVGGETYVALGDGHVFRLSDGREMFVDPHRGNNESPASPVFADGVFYWVSHAVKVTTGNPPTAALCWEMDPEDLQEITGFGIAPPRLGQGDMTSPVVIGDRLFHYNQRRQLVTIDARTGQEIGSRRSTPKMKALAKGVTKNWAYGGLILAGNHLLLVHDNGLMKAFPIDESAGPAGQCALDDDVYARPVCDGTSLYLRTVHSLRRYDAQIPGAQP